MMRRALAAGLFSLTLLLFSGCSGVVNRAVGSAADAAGRTVGERVGEMLVGSFPEDWTPRWTNLYVGYLFGVAFHSGSYVVTDEDAYDPGDWTRWRMADAEGSTSTVIERAFLARTADGDEWWRVKYINTEDAEEIVLEGLFSTDRSELLRLRGRFPGEEAREMPVEEGTYGYAEPVRLTEESIAGATVGTESVTVPAGTFRARHVEYGQPGSTLEWWLTEEVPGGMVRYLQRASTANEGEMPQTWTAELQDHGTGAVSELGVM